MGEIRQLTNGAIQDQATGKIIGMNAPTEQYRALARKRWDKQQRAFADGINEAIKSTGMMPAIDDQDAASMHVIGNKTATLLLDAENARGYSELLGKAVQLAGWAPDARASGDQAQDIARGLAAGVVDSLLDRLQALANGQDE
jgi:hypothetical protein